MSWFYHPRPDGSGKAAAILVQHQAGRSIDSASEAAAPDLVPPASAGSAPNDLHFSVRYRLLEYVSFMWQHAGYLIRRRRIGHLATWSMLVRSTSAAALHFVLQGRGRRTYEFTIDAHGILRAGASGVTLIDWADVRAIRVYSRGFLMVLQRGTLPIPFRCLGGDQVAAMHGFAATRRLRAAH
jgi:hypothetical protein